MNSGNDVVITSKKTNVVVSGYRFYTLSGPYSLQNQTPKTWVLYGSSNKSDWTEIHRVENKTIWNASPTWFEFSIPNNTTAYKYYKFSFLESNYQGTDTPERGNIKISEIEMVQASSVSIPDTNPPTSETYSAFTALDGTAPYEDKEDHSYKNIFIGDYGKDNDRLFYTAGDINDPRYVIFKSNSFGTIIKKYTIISSMSQDPNVSWTFYGCNDHDESIKGDRNNGSWVELDSQSGIKFNNWFYLQNEGNTFTVANPAPYKYYKFEFKPSSENYNSFGYLRISRVVFDKDEAPIVDNSQQTIKSDSSTVSVNIGDAAWFDNDLSTVGLVNYGYPLNLDVMLKGNGAIVYGATYHFATAPQNPSAVSAMFDNATLKLTPYLGTSKTFQHLSTIVSEDFKDYTVLFNVGNNYVKGGKVQYTIVFTSTVTEQLRLAEIDLLHNYACEHSFTGNFKDTTAGDCLHYGYKSYRVCDFNCGACQYYLTDSILEVCEAHQYATEVAIAEAHNWGTEHGATAGDCGHDGNLSYKQCSDCNSYQYTKQGIQFICAESEFDTKIKIPATGKHNQVANSHKNAADPECIYSGNYEYYECSICGYYVYQKDGKTLLGKYDDTQIAPTGEHTWSTTEIIAKVPATCTAAGTKAHWYCNQCQKNYDTDQSTVLTNLTIPALGHTFGDWVAYKPNTCTEDGNWWHHKCTKCDLYEYFIYAVASCDPDDYLAENPGERETTTDYSDITKSLPAQHSWSTTQCAEAKAPTCTEDGNYEYVRCSRCNGYQYKIGENTYFCASDEFNTKVKLPKHHTWGAVVKGTEATCVATGKPAYRPCTVSGCRACQYASFKYDVDADYFDTATSDVYVEDSVDSVPTYSQLSHDFVLVKGSKAPTCTEYGNYNYSKCDRGCNQYKYYVGSTAEYCNATEQDYNTYIRRDKVEHSYGTLIAEEPANCTAKGLAAHYECSECHYLFDENKVQKSLAELELPINPDNHVFATSCQKKCSYCTYERTESERVHKYDTDGNAAYYNNNTEQHAYFCQNDNCSDGILYEDHDMVLIYAQHGIWQHWHKCSKCPYETSKTNCVIKYESKDATNHVSYCEVDGVRHELGESGNDLTSNHSWKLTFKQAKYDADEGTFHDYYCETCNSWKGEETACNVVYYNKDDTCHWQICNTCKHKLSDDEAHDYVMVCDYEDHWLECSVCEKVKDDDYFDHVFETATSTSCSEENCDYQRFLKANFNISGYAIDASVDGLTASAKTDREGVNLTLLDYELLDSNFDQLNSSKGKAISQMTFRPNTVYYAVMLFDCGDVYPSNNMTADDFTLPQGFEYCYFEIIQSTSVQLELFVILVPLGGVSAEKSVSEMEIDLKNFEAGKTFGDVVVDITCKGLPTNKSFTIGSKSYSDVAGSTITDETVIAKTAYSIITSVTAPEGFNFYGLTESDISVKNDMGTAYLMPMGNGPKSVKSVSVAESKVSEDGKTIMIIIVISGLVDEHVCGAGGWFILDSYYDYFCSDKSTQHTQMCKTCAAIEFVNHVFTDDWDTICDDCEYERDLKLDEMKFTLEGYQLDALVKDLSATYAGAYAGDPKTSKLGIVLEAMELVDLNDVQSAFKLSDTARFIPGEKYYISFTVSVPLRLDTSNCMYGNVYVNGTKGKVIIAFADYEGDCRIINYLVELPELKGESEQTKVSNVNLEVEGFASGVCLNEVTFNVEHPAIEGSPTIVVTQNGNEMSPMQAFELGKQYRLIVTYLINDMYYAKGVTAADLKVTHYETDGNSQKTKVATFECLGIEYNDRGDRDGKRTIVCEYLVEVVIPAGIGGHLGHTFPTESPDYFIDENKHYVLCGCGAHDEGQAHSYDESEPLVCKVCSYERKIVVDKVTIEVNCNYHVGMDADAIFRDSKMFVGDIELDLDSDSFPFVLSMAGIFEGIHPDFNKIFGTSLDEADTIYPETDYAVALMFMSIGEYIDDSALTEKTVSIIGLGEKALTPTYMASLRMGTTNLIGVIFQLPKVEVGHVHGGEWMEQVPATVTTEGTVAHYTCTICGKHFDKDNNEIADIVIPKVEPMGQFKAKVDAVQNATTVEDMYRAIVEANATLALYDDTAKQAVADEIVRLNTLIDQYKQMAQNATTDVTNAVNVIGAVFGALVQMAIVALATVIVKRRLF